MWFFGHRGRSERARREVDTCIACAAPVYEGDGAFDVLGLWMHRACYDKDLGLREQGERRGERAA